MRGSDKPKSALAQLIREIRGFRSYREFAEALGVTYQTPSYWENGVHSPTPAHMRALAREATPEQLERLQSLVFSSRN
jgi:transcriptional regulator with XRE-family HTH domain